MSSFECEECHREALFLVHRESGAKVCADCFGDTAEVKRRLSAAFFGGSSAEPIQGDDAQAWGYEGDG